MRKFKENVLQSRKFFQYTHSIKTYKKCKPREIKEICMRLKDFNI